MIWLIYIVWIELFALWKVKNWADPNTPSDPNDDTALMQQWVAYDGLGHVVRQAVLADPNSPLNYIADPNTDKVTDFVYDDANGDYPGMLVAQTIYYADSPATAATTTYDYDLLSRRYKTTDPAGNETLLTFDLAGRVQRRQQTDINPIQGQNNLITATEYEYDDIGRLENLIVDPNNWTETQTTEYAYDALGRQIWIAGYTDDTDVDTEQVTHYTYDNLGRITVITYPDEATIEYGYSPAGKVIKRTDQRGIETFYEYDDVYNMTEKQVTMDSVTTTESFTYDGLGRMLTATKYEDATFISESEFGYNDMGRISGADERYFSFAAKSIDYAYDNAGNRIQTVYPDGSTTIDRTNTWDGRIDTLTKNSTPFAEYDYIGSQTARKKLGSYVYYEPEYDNLGRMTRSYTYETNGTPSTITDFDYTYETDENNIATITFDHRPNTPYNAYTYDNLDRLTEADYLVGVLTEDEGFGMDDVGNRTTVNLRSGSQVYDVNDLTNRYTSIDEEDCTYDAAGNLTVDHNGYQYTYDYENRITWIGNSGGGVAAFDYDALGRRIRIFDYESIHLAHYYYNDQWQVLYKQGLFGYNSCTYVWGNYIDEALAMNTYYYAHDHLYSPAALTDSAGTVGERYEYDAYGSTQILTSNFSLLSSSAYGNPTTFTGRELYVFDNGNLKIMYYRNRYYSPEIGRFMTQDPLGIEADCQINQLFNLKWQDYFNLYPTQVSLNRDKYNILFHRAPYYELSSGIQDTTYNYQNIFYPLRQYYDGVNLYQYTGSNSVNKSDWLGLTFTGCYANCFGVGYLFCWSFTGPAMDKCIVAVGLTCIGICVADESKDYGCNNPPIEDQLNQCKQDWNYYEDHPDEYLDCLLGL